jgi:hypothetical protein
MGGVIYYAADHFIARFIMNAGRVWYHDGLLTCRSLVYENMVPSQIPHEDAVPVKDRGSGLRNGIK